MKYSTYAKVVKLEEIVTYISDDDLCLLKSHSDPLIIMSYKAGKDIENEIVRLDAVILVEGEEPYWKWIYQKVFIDSRGRIGIRRVCNEILKANNLKIVCPFLTYKKEYVEYCDFFEDGDVLVRDYLPFGYIYKITCLENNRSYVGQCQLPYFNKDYWSSSQNDDYWKDLELYGKEKFKREILCWCYSEEELFNKEYELIKSENAGIDHGGYNLSINPYQNTLRIRGLDYRYDRYMYWTEEKRKLHGELIKNSERYKQSRLTVGEKISKAKKENYNPETYAFTQTKEFKEKIASISSGKVWYTNGEVNIFIKPDVISPEGFVKGMTQHSPHLKFTEEHKQALAEARKGKNWYTDGKTDKYVRECPGEGWVIGRVNTGTIDLIW